MRAFPCDTPGCKGMVGATREPYYWAFGVLRVWVCVMCHRRYLLDGATPTT